jgi:uncharacterized protein (DUF2384 family)
MKTNPPGALSIREPSPRYLARPEVAFWHFSKRDAARDPDAVFRALLQRVQASADVERYDAVEQGVPATVVPLIAAAFGDTAASVMDLIGVSESTFRRKEEANEPLPEVAGHRVMGFLHLVATLRRLLQESGDPEQLASFDLEAWVSEWLRVPLPEFGGRTPAQLLRNPEGQRALEGVFRRMRGGLPA